MQRRQLAVALGALVAIGAGVTVVLLPRDGDDSAGRALPTGFVGLVAEDVYAGGARYRSANLRRQRRAGVELLRQTFDWSQIEKSAGRYDFSYHDRYVAALAARGVRLLPVLFNPPRFRSARPARGAERGTYPPRRYSDLGAFATRLVNRYGPRGSFWAEHPKLPKLPVRAWQVWNEPSLPVYWPPRPDPAEYTALLRVTSRALKRADPGAEVVTAGLSESRLGIPFERFVKGMYAAGGGRSFDTLAIHPYARAAVDATDAVAGARRLIRRQGDDADIRITELGWASGGPPSPFTVGPRGQALRVRRALAALIARRRELGLRGVVYFNWKDAPPYAGAPDFWGLHTGLLDIKGRAKPALAAFERGVREGAK